MTGRSIFKVLCGVVAVVMLAGCIDEQPVAGEERQAQPVTQKQAKPSKPVESVDALDLAQDTIPISRQLTKEAQRGMTRLVPPAKIFPGGDAVGKDTLAAQVFRVQLGMIDTYSEARRALAVAQELFDQPVTLDYEVPYYKLRVGEFATRKEAESYQQKAKGAGYNNAWVMVGSVTIRQIEPMYPSVDSAKADSVRQN